MTVPRAPAPGSYCCLLLLAAVIPGVQLQATNSPVEVQFYRPVLQPTESIPSSATYTLKKLTGRACIKATLGVEYIVVDKKIWYYNLDPSRVRISGYCGKMSAILSLTLPNNAASLQMLFTKEKNIYYVTRMTAHVSPLPICRGCKNQTYAGVVDHEKLFVTKGGRSFKCKSENLLRLSSVLRIKLIPMQIQAFTLKKGKYGKEAECWADYNKRIIPIIIGATVVGLLLIALLTYITIRDRRQTGYESL